MGFQDEPLPLKPAEDEPKALAPPRLAPPIVPLLSAWIGLLSVILSASIPFVPGTVDPVGELTHARPYSWADRVLLVAIYLQPTAMFLGIVTIWQMRKEARPLPDGLVIQRLQAWVGIGLGLVGAVIIYVFVYFRGPGAGGGGK